MKIEEFKKKSDLLGKTEIEKTGLLAFYFYKTENVIQFSSKDISYWFDSLNLGRPNISRLIKNIIKSPLFIKGNGNDTYQLHPKSIEAYENEINWFDETSEEISFNGAIIPREVFTKTRGYIEKLAEQINASYENNIFDGCAVLMRRLIEILLIHVCQNTGQENRIIDSSGKYKNLSTIINEVKSNPSINLSKYTNDCIDNFRILGNFSVHKIEYNCRRDDLKKIALDFRATVEELLYKSGIRT